MYKKIYSSMRFIAVFVLILTAVLVTSACYTGFNQKMKNEIKNDTLMIKKLIAGIDDKKDFLEKNKDVFDKKRVTLLSNSGDVLFDSATIKSSYENQSQNPEIQQVFENGYGSSQRYSNSVKKICYYYAIRLNPDEILRISGALDSFVMPYLAILLPIILMVILIYFLSGKLSARLTENIIKPIEEINVYEEKYDNVYEELIPFVTKIANQNKQRRMTEEIRKEFSANVSHELKTPLTTIHGYTQLINNKIAKEEDIFVFTKKIEKETIRLISLIDDIMKLSRLDENTQPAEKHRVDLKSVATEVINDLLPKASSLNITLTLEGDDSNVYANGNQIRELIYNLCDNGIKYNKDNGNVKINIKDNKIIVSDTGIGIPKEYEQRIFERFFRVDKSHSKQVNGTGLGLSIVKHIAICNNAKINVESTLGEGTIFTVEFF